MDNSNVLALKYRPTKLADLIGQDSVNQAILNAFKDGRLYQSFLFAGSFGCGKTSTARILAAMENCEKGPTAEPCGECKMCREIFSGTSTDIKEVNAASDNGIDTIRNIEDFVGGGRLLARVKYVILDECHALSRAAVESALKIFEEPPDNVRFILCTTDLHKMKGTIQSRCMPFRFTKVSWPVLAQHLSGIAKKENFNIEDSAIKLAAKLADGSVRNSLRNLELVINYAGSNPATGEIAQKALGAIDDHNWFALVDSVLGMDAMTGMKIIQEIFSKGHDASQVIDGLTEHLRGLMVLMTCKNTSGLLFMGEAEQKLYIHQIGRMSIDLVVEMISLLHEVTRGLYFSMNPQMLFETYFIKAIQAHSKIERLRKEMKAA